MYVGTHALFHETAAHIAHSPRFISTKNPSPTRLQRFPGTSESWNPYPMRSENQYVMEKNSPTPMEGVQYTGLSPATHGRSGRSGPLSHDQRKEANDVRKKGACLRCIVMKEKVGCLPGGFPSGTNVTSATVATPAIIARLNTGGSFRSSAYPVVSTGLVVKRLFSQVGPLQEDIGHRG